jgi:hypothetical protein
MNTYAAALLSNLRILIGKPRQGAMVMACVCYGVCILGVVSVAGGCGEPRGGVNFVV